MYPLTSLRLSHADVISPPKSKERGEGFDGTFPIKHSLAKPLGHLLFYFRTAAWRGVVSLGARPAPPTEADAATSFSERKHSGTFVLPIILLIFPLARTSWCCLPRLRNGYWSSSNTAVTRVTMAQSSRLVWSVTRGALINFPVLKVDTKCNLANGMKRQVNP